LIATPVAIKVLAPEYAANGNARKRFEGEARAAAAVIHDHVVPVHAVDAEATPPYLVMAFIAGPSLQQRIDRSAPLELKEVLRLGMQMASGLAAAHAQGLVHRDIKPANIMLENGIERVRITDFGLAKAVHDASVTQSGAVTGTPQYMSPEQAEGGAVDQRADLFALGSTLYAMATGQAPFRGDSALAIMRQVCDTDPAPLGAIHPAMPAWLEAIVQKLHRKNPEQRFQSAAEVATLLEGCLAHVQQPDRYRLPALAAKLGREVSASRKTRRYWRPAMAGVALMGFLACGTFFLLPGSPQDGQVMAPAIRAAAAAGIEAAVDADGKTFDQGSAEVQGKLDSMNQSLSAGARSEWIDPVTGLNQLNQQTDKLRRSLNAVPKLAPDPVDVQLEIIREQLYEFLRRAESGGK
jgi:Protein kinase domain